MVVWDGMENMDDDDDKACSHFAVMPLYMAGWLAVLSDWVDIQRE